MIVFQKFLYKCMGIASGLLAVAWLLPQSLFRDCVHVVLPEEQKEERMDDEKYAQLFRLEDDNYKIVWKFTQKD